MEGLRNIENSETNFKVHKSYGGQTFERWELSACRISPVPRNNFPCEQLYHARLRSDLILMRTASIAMALGNIFFFCYVCLSIYIHLFTLALSFIKYEKNVQCSVLFLLTQTLTTCGKLTMVGPWQNKNIYNKSMWSSVGTIIFVNLG